MRFKRKTPAVWMNTVGVRDLSATGSDRTIFAPDTTDPPSYDTPAHTSTFFNIGIMPMRIRTILEASVAEADLPHNTYYGDGGRIEPEVVRELQSAYEDCTRSFEWRGGDLLMLDNMLVAHGREPFTGARTVLVGMAEAHTRA
jgi:hypothetical protein